MTTFETFPKSTGGGTFKGQARYTIGDFRSVSRQTAIIESFLKDRTPGPLEVPEAEAEIRWGQPSTFNWSVTNPTGGFSPISVVINYNDNDDDDDDDEEGELGPKTLEFIETERITEDVRVENPSDAQQYVIVQRINEITFEAPSDLADSLLQLRNGQISNLYFKYILNFEDQEN